MSSLRIGIGADHAGFKYKQILLEVLSQAGYNLIDLGVQSEAPADYPDVARTLAEAMRAEKVDRGILICGSGVGASIAANKIKGARACLCHDIYSAVQGVEHDDMNILCLGGLIVGTELARRLVVGFLDAHFLDEGRYLRRLNKVITLES